jgi:hypothetical protein
VNDRDDDLASTAAELFALLERDWTNIARHLTASYSQRRKKLLLQSFSSQLPAIEQHIQAQAAAGNNDEANHWRRAEVFVRSIMDELEMWLALQNNEIPSAWDAFCSAEGRATRVAAWLPDHSLARQRVRHLAEVERVVFPHQPWFLSSGLIVSKETCTICNSDYGTCKHLAGEIYNGTLAWRRADQIQEALHLAFVREPSNKRCRITTSSNGNDPLTGEPPRRAAKKQPSDNRCANVGSSRKSKRQRRRQ